MKVKYLVQNYQDMRVQRIWKNFLFLEGTVKGRVGKKYLERWRGARSQENALKLGDRPL